MSRRSHKFLLTETSPGSPGVESCSKRISEVFLPTASREWSMSWSSHCPHCITWNQFENKLDFQIRHKESEPQNTRSKRKSVLDHHVRKPWVWGDSDTGQKGTGDQAWVWLPAATMSWSNQKLLYPQQIPVCVSLT